jgi:diguanylate cyclase (GGDEF)-like protein
VKASTASRLFDSSVCAAGAIAGVVALLSWLFGQDVADPAFFLGVPLIMVMSWFPMLIGRTGGRIEIGFDSCVLIFLSLLTTPVQALAVWSVGLALGQLLTDKRRSTKAFNTGLGVVAGALALLVIHSTRGSAEGTPRELLAVGLGAAVYFLVDFVVSAVSLSLDERTSIRRELAPTGVVPPLVAFLAIASLGYLAVLVVRRVQVGALPGWSAALLAVPIATILVASRAQSRGSEYARRLRVLLTTAIRVQTVTTTPEVLEELRVGASDLLNDARTRLSKDPPHGSEIGVSVQGGGEQMWIVSPALNRARSTARDDQQGLAALVALAEDAFARLRLSDAMTHLAWHDPLTGLANRSLFLDRVEHAMQMQARRGGQLAVLFCDLDGFKRVNDLFGHAAGDELLTEVARRISSSVRQADTVARLGGDEFAVLLEEVGDSKEVDAACSRILQSVRVRSVVAGEDVAVTTTIGVAMSQPGTSADALLSQADMAMYYGKAHGKNRYETYRLSFGDDRLQRIELVETLRRAVEAKDLEVHYQPIVELRTGDIFGVEALVRWRRDGTLVPPDLFIRTAEESGLIVALGDIVLEMVTRDVPRLTAAAGQALHVGVNVSAQQLQRDQFATQVRAALKRMGDVNLILEVTERDFVDNDPQTVAGMTSLAATDVRFAIDDFGVGFSSIGYLQRLPVSILKIDKTFMTNIETEPRSCSLVRSMVVMGEALGLEVVIEGVETATQVEHLTQHCGASRGQGYFFDHPMPVDAMIDVLSARAVAATASVVVPTTA